MVDTGLVVCMQRISLSTLKETQDGYYSYDYVIYLILIFPFLIHYKYILWFDIRERLNTKVRLVN